MVFIEMDFLRILRTQFTAYRIMWLFFYLRLGLTVFSDVVVCCFYPRARVWPPLASVVAVRPVRALAADRPRVSAVPTRHGRPATPQAVSPPGGLLQEHRTALLLLPVSRPPEGLPRFLPGSRRCGAQLGHRSRRLYPFIAHSWTLLFDGEVGGFL